MRNALTTVAHILRKDLLIPVNRIRPHQNLKSSAGLSSTEWNAFLYYVEEQFKVELNTLSPTSTMAELVNKIESNRRLK